MSEFTMARILFILCIAVLHGARGHDHEEQCIEGLYHKKSPSRENHKYYHCQPWKELTCCTSEFTKELVANETRTLYNHSWHLCGQLSPQCLDFWFKQECFYQCSPYVYQWKSQAFKEAIEGVPICSDYCDQWFDACKQDQICVTDVLTGYNFSMHGENSCPSNENCTTYADRFKNGEGLCTKMWSSSYVYQKPNSDRSNCMVMWFNNSNPNANVKKESVDSASKTVFRVLDVGWAVIFYIVIVGIVSN